MGRYKNSHGVVVNVDDATAARIGSKWVPIVQGESDEPGTSDETPKPDATWTVENLKIFATEQGIELKSTKKEDIVAEIETALTSKAAAGDEGNGSDNE